MANQLNNIIKYQRSQGQVVVRLIDQLILSYKPNKGKGKGKKIKIQIHKNAQHLKKLFSPVSLTLSPPLRVIGICPTCAMETDPEC